MAISARVTQALGGGRTLTAGSRIDIHERENRGRGPPETTESSLTGGARDVNDNADGGNAKGQGEPDYAAIDTPDPREKPHEEWTYAERRAYIYREWIDRGSHQLLNKSQLARNFDVNRRTIYNDLDRIADFVDENMSRHHGTQTTAVFQRAVAELLDEGEYKDAAQVQDMMSDWLERRGAIDKEPDEHRVAKANATELDDDDLEWLDEVF